MKPLKRPDNARIESIFHPSDFSEDSLVAFAHALKIALATRAELNMLHVSSDTDFDWQDFPGIRSTLERWKLIPPGSPRKAVGMLGIDVNKALTAGKDPLKACLAYMDTHHTDLIVLAIHRHEGRMRWLHKHVGEPLANKSGQMTLFIPQGVKGFVSLDDGAVSLRNILIPVTHKPDAQPAIKAVDRLVKGLGLTEGNVTLLHVGVADGMPSLELPQGHGWKWNPIVKEGDPVETILKVAGETKADLVVMTTDGPEGFLDGLRGTTSERVLHRIGCPVACLPAGSMMG